MPSLLIIALLVQTSAGPAPSPAQTGAHVPGAPPARTRTAPDAPFADPPLEPPAPLAERPTYALGASERAKRLTIIGASIVGVGAVLFTIGTVQYEGAQRAALENVERIRGSGLSNSIGGTALLLVGACVLWMAAVAGQWAFAQESSTAK